jgi:GT2 family glycosyltransferase/glycosyltransferase involved in cell wall biosynthesis
VTEGSVPSLLVEAARAVRQQQWAAACGLYVQAARLAPDAPWVRGNLLLLARQYRRSRPLDGRLSVGVCGWELSHNAAGRVQMLADLYARFADVQLLGCHFPAWGRSLWPPLSPPRWPVHSFVVEDEASFLHQAVDLVAAHPYDVVHLSKPRAPTVLIGMLYKLLWGSRVLMDVDDEELAFVDAQTPISREELLSQAGQLPALRGLAGKQWTQLAVGLAAAFDGVTVASSALQARYGGQLLRHARDETLFKCDSAARAAARTRFGIEPEKKVVLFFGTPRTHKGLVETAEAVAQLPSRDVVFVVAGEFADPGLRQRLLAVEGCDTRLLGMQPYADVASVVAMADACVLLQQQDALVSAYQVPAKLSDALALGVPVLAQRTAALAEFFESGAVVEVTPVSLVDTLWHLLTDEVARAAQSARARAAFEAKLSFPVNAAVLEGLVSTSEPPNAAHHRWAWPGADRWAADAGPPQWLEDYVPGAFLPPPPAQGGEKSAGPAASPLVVGNANGAATVVPTTAGGPFAAVCHVYYLELWPELAAAVSRLPAEVPVYVTAPMKVFAEVSKAVAATTPRAQVVEVPDEGMDVVPFLALLPHLSAQGCSVVLKLHTKKGRGSEGERWRKWMLDALAGTADTLRAVMEAFASDPQLALVGPAALYLSAQKLTYANGPHLSQLLDDLGCVRHAASPDEEPGFFAGSMFWCRVERLLPLASWLDTWLRRDGGALEPAMNQVGLAGGTDGRLEHALERAIGPVALRGELGSPKVGLLHPSAGHPAGPRPWVISVAPARLVPPGKAHVGEFLRGAVHLRVDAQALSQGGKAFFDAVHYRGEVREELGEQVDLVAHYLTRGLWLGWEPVAAFPIGPRIRAHLRACGSRRNALAFSAALLGDLDMLAAAERQQDQSPCRHTLARSGLFDEQHYRSQLDADDKMPSDDPVVHYLQRGVYGGLQPHAGFDPLAYWAANRDVLAAGVEPFFHYLTVGARQDRPLRPKGESKGNDQVTSGALRRVVLSQMTIDWRSLAARVHREATVSVVIPVLDQPELTRACLESLFTTPAGIDFEVICVDNGSAEPTRQILDSFRREHPISCRVLRLSENLHFALGCNLGFAQARGEIVVFLNNDTTVTTDWLARLVRPLSEPAVVAVQPRLLFPDGRLQCGGVVFSARQDLGYPLYAGVAGDEPCALISRDLQAVTGACMAMRAADFARCRGFDPSFTNGQEDVDLCLRLTASLGTFCRYEPSSTVIHHEGQSAGRFDHARSNRQVFLERWRGRIRPDDTVHYTSDGFEVEGYDPDSLANEALGVAVYRPRLVRKSAEVQTDPERCTRPMNSAVPRLPINVLLLGNCVVRDPFELDRRQGGNDFNVAAFYSLTSIASMAVLPMHGFDVSAIEDSWRRRMAEADMRKDFLAHLERNDVDLVLVDFTVDTFTLLLGADGCGFTVSSTFLSKQSLLDGLPPERYNFDHPVYREHWVRGWKKVVGILRPLGRLDRLLVNRVYFAKVDDAGKPFEGQSARIDRANDFMDWAYAQAMEDLPARQFIEYPREAFVGRCDHKWGRYYAHYVEAVEQACIDGVRAYVSGWLPHLGPVSPPAVSAVAA